MASEEQQSGTPRVAFTGSRSALFGLLFAGYLLMIPTLGLYRFWLTTEKRRYYWKHTLIDGDPLEYTGNARQLLIGFLFALAFFLPLYVAFVYFSTQPGTFALVGYITVGAVLWFLAGYAFYRGRDFRLSRTLWRGIRFDVKGRALVYALRRFLWSLLVVVTAGLAYPFMVGDLWRYRWRNTWYGDRQMSFVGSWKTVAVPFYVIYVLLAVPVVATLYFIGIRDFRVVGERTLPGVGISLSVLGALLMAAIGWFYFRSREATRMYSSIRIGVAAVTVKVSAWRLFGQFLLYSLLLLITVLLIVGIGFGVFIAATGGHLGAGGTTHIDVGTIARGGWVGIVFVVGGYLVLFADFALMGEVFLGWGYWSAIARRATVSNLDSLRTVRATAEDPALIGEGLAEALNMGSF